jgi:putative ABC transport system permease protein
MFQNYLKTTWRNLLRHRAFSAINLVGLALGLAVVLLIGLFVQHELSYDAFHAQADRIVLFRQWEQGTGAGGGFAERLQRELPGVARTVRVMTAIGPMQVRVGDRTQTEERFAFADSTFLQVFDFALALGDRASALRNPQAVLLSQRAAQKYFPGQEAVGKTLKINKQYDFVVTGILADFPTNSTLQLDMVANSRQAEAIFNFGKLDGWWDGLSVTYLQLEPQAALADLQARLPQVVAGLKDPNSGVWAPQLLPLRDLRLYHQFEDGRLQTGRTIDKVYLFTTIALLVLLLAVFNYVNLATARAGLRAREVGVRKVLGAGRGALWGQFMGEALLFTGLATGVAAVLASLLLPYFNELGGLKLSLTGLASPGAWLVGAGFLVVLSLLAGSYPALVLAGFKPVEALKNRLHHAPGRFSFRQVLVVAQFAISIGILAATLLVMNQLRFMRHKELGFDQAQVVSLRLPNELPHATKVSLAQELGRLAPVEAATLANMLPGQGTMRNKLVETYVPKGKDVGYQFMMVDTSYRKVFNIKLLQGRELRLDSGSNEFIVNRAMAEYLGWGNDILGRELGYYKYEYAADGGYREVPVRGPVVGLIDDYHQHSLHTPIAPMAWQPLPNGLAGQIAVRVRPGQLTAALASLEQTWQKVLPNQPMDYYYPDQAFAQTYQSEITTGRIFGHFAGLAIVISCLGLLGLAAFAAERRVKEIGIRKVLGASVPQVVALLSRDFVKLVLLAFLIASPVAYYLMDRWLAGFAYRVPLGAWVFVLAGAGGLAVALLTVGWQAARAAAANPVKSLRSE